MEDNSSHSCNTLPDLRVIDKPSSLNNLIQKATIYISGMAQKPVAIVCVGMAGELGLALQSGTLTAVVLTREIPFRLRQNDIHAKNQLPSPLETKFAICD